MRLKFAAAALAALAAAASGLAVAPATAEAGEVLDRLRSRGLGKWVDKYVDEDKTGKVRYKRASEDKWSSSYYDSKTGTWTGKKDGLTKNEAIHGTGPGTPALKKSTASLKTAKLPGSSNSAALTGIKRKKLAGSATKVKSASTPLSIKPAVSEPGKPLPGALYNPASLPAAKPDMGDTGSTPLGPARLSERYGPELPVQLGMLSN